MKPKPLKQEEYSMKIIEDLGLIPTPSGTRNARFAIVECTKCKKHFKIRMGSKAAKNQSACIDCNKTKHGLYKEPLYAIWNGIKQRCYSPKRKDYPKYGGKGVTVCDEWKDDVGAFISWCKSNGWSPDKVIDKDIKSKELGISPAVYGPDTVTFVSAQENAEAANAKKVMQFTKEGEYVNTYDSNVKAAIAMGKPGSSKSSIANCARGLTKSAFGYVWKYA
jgi:hypothetical protein